MGNTKQAPVLIHEGDLQDGKQFYIIEQGLIETIFNELSGKNGNALKLILFLIGNSGTGNFRVSEKIVEKQTGMNSKSYRRARDELEELEWIKHDKGKITVKYQNIVRKNRQVNKSTLDRSSNPF